MKRLPQEEDQIVFLLCKQNQELYVLEVHLKDGQRPRTITKHHLRLQSPNYGKKLLEFLGSNEFFDISDLCELQIDLEEVQEFDSLPEYQDDFENMSIGSKTDSRPISAKSAFSDMSMSKTSSRPDSGSSQQSTISTASLESLLWENEHYLTDQLLGEPSIATEILTSTRPATAISIMRLPSGSRPMVIVPKTRPSTAKQWVDKFKTHMKSNEDLFEEQPGSYNSSSQSFFQKQSCYSSIDNYEALNLEYHYSPSSSVKSASKVPIAKKRPPTATTSKKASPTTNFFSKNQQLLHFTSKSRQPSRKVVTPRKAIASPIKVTIKKNPCCTLCQKKLGPAQTFLCKCEKQFCAQHRYSDRHTCTYDYKASAKVALREANPLIKSDKLLRL